MSRHNLTREERVRGGKAAASLPFPRWCVCGAGPFTSRMQYVGHLGNHKLAKSLEEKTGVKWSVADALRDGLARMGAAYGDPAPWNGAFKRGHDLLLAFGHDLRGWGSQLEP